MQGSSRELVSGVISKWRNGAAPNALEVISKHPELRGEKSAILELAYEEFCLRAQSGESVDSGDFCQRFPAYRTSLARLLEVHSYFADHPNLVDPSEVQWPPIGADITGFLLEDELGRGGFARVYLAREALVGNRQVVVKLSRNGAQEADTLGQLKHENIVLVHSVQHDPDSGLTIVCMPYLGRATLCDCIDRAFVGGSAPKTAQPIVDAIIDDPAAQSDGPRLIHPQQSYVAAVAEIMAQLADALASTHKIDLLHRDLKPSNILLTPAGKPMLLDFNLSGAAAGPRPIGGTLPYMAPEQIRAIFSEDGHTADPIDARSDIYSLGVIMYEMLTGQVPFLPTKSGQLCEESAREFLTQIAGGALPLRERNPDVDPQLATIVSRCMTKSPEERFQSAAELRDELRNYLAPYARLLRWARRHIVAVASAATVAIALLTCWVFMLLTRPSFETREFNAGRAAYNQGDYAGAIEHFTQIIALAPKSATARFARAQCEIRTNDYDAASEDLRVAAKQRREGIILAMDAYCCAQQGDAAAAEFSGEEAVRRGMRTAPVLNNLGYSKLQQNKLVESQRILEEAIDLDENLPQAIYNRLAVGGHEALRTGKVSDSTLEYARKTIQAKDSDPHALYAAADLYAIAAKSDKSLIDGTIDALRRAKDAGIDVGMTATDQRYSAVWPQIKTEDLARTRPARILTKPFSPLAIPTEKLELAP